MTLNLEVEIFRSIDFLLFFDNRAVSLGIGI